MFHVMNPGWSCHCFALYHSVVAMYYSDSPMKHLLFVEAFMWDDVVGNSKLTNFQSDGCSQSKAPDRNVVTRFTFAYQRLRMSVVLIFTALELSTVV